LSLKQKRFTKGLTGFNSQSASRQEREILNHFKNKLQDSKSPKGSASKGLDSFGSGNAPQSNRLHSQHVFQRVNKDLKESGKVASTADSAEDKPVSSPGLRQSLNLIHYPHVNPGFRE
jgi:hypothetical protein